jgi:SAM-dependent methyltransferase
MLKAYGLSKELIVDVGCGPGFDTATFHREGLSAIGADLSANMLKLAREQYQGDFILADMRRLPLAQKVGGLWVSASMLHIPLDDVPETLRNFSHFLLPGGLLYLSLKLGNNADWRTGPYGEARFFTYYQPERLDKMIREAGFQIVEGWQSGVLEDQTQWLMRFARKAPPGNFESLELLK